MWKIAKISKEIIVNAFENCPLLTKPKSSFESSLKREEKPLDTFFPSLQPDSVLFYILYTAIANL